MRAQAEKLLGDARRHSKASSGIFDINHDQIDGVSLKNMMQVSMDDPASCTAKNVTDKKYLQGE
mgnify:CR=1 FL=1